MDLITLGSQIGNVATPVILALLYMRLKMYEERLDRLEDTFFQRQPRTMRTAG